jgi:5-methylcytosine-specific restriction protein A
MSRGRRLPHPCRGCGALITGRLCSSCEVQQNRSIRSRKQVDPALAVLDKFYKSEPWRRLRAAKLRRDPFCAACSREDSPVLAREVDHKIQITAGGPLLPELDALDSLCKPCHDRKRQAEATAARTGKRRADPPAAPRLRPT